MRLSSMIGYCLRTSAAAWRPSSTSCCGVYLFLASLIWVCATTPATDSAQTRKAAAGARSVLIAMANTIHPRLFPGTPVVFRISMPNLPFDLATALGLGREATDLTFGQISLRGIIVFVAALAIVRSGDRRFLSQK